jgi:hypothetical protein
MTVFLRGGNSVAFSATTSSNSSSLNGSGDVIRVVNESNTDGFIKTGVGAQTATSSDVYLAPLSTSFLQIDFADDTVAAVATTGTITVRVHRGSAR